MNLIIMRSQRARRSEYWVAWIETTNFFVIFPSWDHVARVIGHPGCAHD